VYAEPHADSAFAHLLMGANGVRPFRDVVPLVRAEALKALELDPTETGPHALMGAIAAAHDYDWMEAAAQFRLAMAATRVSPDTRWAYLSFYLGTLRPVRESVAEMERAVEQDPLNVTWRAVLSGRFYAAEMHERALEEGLKARDLDENQWFPHFILAEIYLAPGKLDEAIAEGEGAHHAGRWHFMPTGVLARTLARAGERGRAEALTEMGESPRPIWGRVLYSLT
jgi:tetratricopeptide (TPR) repeat protein